MSQASQKGFERLKGAAVAGAMGLGLAGVGPIAAATTTRASVSGYNPAESLSYSFQNIGRNSYGYTTTTTNTNSYYSSNVFAIGDAWIMYSVSFYSPGTSYPTSTYTRTTSSSTATYYRYRWHELSSLSNFSSSSSYSYGYYFNNSLISPASSCTIPASVALSGLTGFTNGGVASDFNTDSQTVSSSPLSFISSNSLTNCFNIYEVVRDSWSSYWTITGTTTTGGSTYPVPVTRSDAFNHALWMQVDGNFFTNPGGVIDYTTEVIPDESVEVTTLTSATETDIVSGLDAQVEYFFVDKAPIVRARYTLKNSTASAISTSLRVGGSLGSVSYYDDTIVHATSSGDTTTDNADQWHVSSDAYYSEFEGEGSDPIITISRFGEGARVTPDMVVGLSEGEGSIFVNEYNVTVPANGEITVMVFAELSRTVDGAIEGAPKFESIEAIAEANEALLYGLTKPQLASTVNYGAEEELQSELIPPEIKTKIEDEDDDFEFFGSLGIPSLILAMCYGFLGWQRRKV